MSSWIAQFEVARTPSPGTTTADIAVPGAKWYAISVYSRHEKLVARCLAEGDVRHLLPLYRSVRRWKDRRKELDMVLFPGYVFVNVFLRDRLRVLQVPGVVNFVTFQGRPTPVPESEIQSLSSGLASGLDVQPHPYLRAGRRVRVTRGPLASSEGILVRKKDHFRLVLSVDLLMRSVSVEVDECDVVPC
jgi:transcription antitermination factor NusG